LALGGRLRIVQPKVPPAEWTVTAVEPGGGFRLVSRSPGATVEANHWAEPTEAGHRSRVTLSVTFTGFLGRVIGWMMRGLNNRYLAQEAAGLKRRSEERARSRVGQGVNLHLTTLDYIRHLAPPRSRINPVERAEEFDGWCERGIADGALLAVA
jgi:hypothetical protein